MGLRNSGKNINSIVGNGKRFIAYDLVGRLKQGGLGDVLESLSSSRNKKHEMFEPSFDWKECNDEYLLLQPTWKLQDID